MLQRDNAVDLSGKECIMCRTGGAHIRLNIAYKSHPTAIFFINSV